MADEKTCGCGRCKWAEFYRTSLGKLQYAWTFDDYTHSWLCYCPECGDRLLPDGETEARETEKLAPPKGLRVLAYEMPGEGWEAHRAGDQWHGEDGSGNWTVGLYDNPRHACIAAGMAYMRDEGAEREAIAKAEAAEDA